MTLSDDFKKEYKKLFDKYKPKYNLGPINWGLVLVQLALILQAVLLIMEFWKYPDLDFNRIFVLQLFVISTKISWLLIKK